VLETALVTLEPAGGLHLVAVIAVTVQLVLRLELQLAAIPGN
jgi:hypothetical protein